MTEENERERAIQDYRIAIEKSVENDEQKGLHGYNPTWNATEAERLRERGALLDENERIAKERYDSLGCQDATGLSSDEYRRKTIEEIGRKENELREKKRAEIQARMESANSNTNHL